MRTKVNPDPHAQGFTPHPKYNVTAVINELSALTSAIRSLNQAGFSDEHISVFTGKNGLAKLDLDGEAHGFLAQVVRTLESLTTEEQAISREIEDCLKRGRYFVAVRSDGTEEQKTTVEHILKDHKAQNVRFFGAWTVERL